MTVKLWGVDQLHLRFKYHSDPIHSLSSAFLFKMLFISFFMKLTFKCLKKECMKLE